MLHARETGGFRVVEVGCLAPRNFPRTEWFLENPHTGRRNGEEFSCAVDYGCPFDQSRLSFEDPVGHFHYAVDGSQLPDARVRIRVYRPEAHFTRQVVIPDIRLGDWTPQF